MRCENALLLIALLGLTIAGCGEPAGQKNAAPGGSAVPGQAANSASTDDPAAAVGVFLEAVRTGNDKKASEMFTSLARERVSKLGIQVAPQGSDTASFKIGKIERLAPDGARVAAQWTDLGDDGKPRTDDMMWMLRKEKEGWRVAGMAATVFPGEPPLLLDFENPEETLKQLDMLRAEINRRNAGPGQAQGQPGDARVAAQATEAQAEGAPPNAQTAGGQNPGSPMPLQGTEARNPENSFGEVRR